MKDEKKRKRIDKRTVKYKDLVKSLEKEREQIRKEIEEEKKAAEASVNEQEGSNQDDVYNEDIHRAIEELEKEVTSNKLEKKEKTGSTDITVHSEEIKDDWSCRKAIPILSVCIVSVVLLIGLTVMTAVHLLHSEEPETVDRSAEETELKLMDPELRTMWLSNKDLNEDYMGQIVFDSGLIDLPFVQAKGTIKENGEPYRFYTADGQIVEDPYAYNGNDVYIWTSWKTGEYDRYEEGGSVFMDYRNYLKDQNIILYGHHFARDWDPSGSKQFTPLDVLLSEENYEENKNLRLILDNEIRSYVVTNVFTVDIEDDYESQIIRTDMNEDFSGTSEPRFFREFISYMDRISRYETGEELTEKDRILTLITCLEHQPQYRQIVVCKEVSDEIFDPS